MTAENQLEARLIDAPALPVYDLVTEHPFARDRQVALFDLIQRMGLVRPEELLRSEPASEQELQLAHHPAYIAMVQAVSAPDPDDTTLSAALRFGLGSPDNPIGKGQHAAAAAMTGATLACVREVMAGAARHGFNPAGGLHHALPQAASGFCVYNDLVVGIRTALELGAERVLYVDFDVHHGDGVEFAFQRDPSVLTLSFHQHPDTLYPGTGRITDLGDGDAQGTVVNMPLAPGTGDESWWEAVETLLPKLVRRFGPAVIVSQHGCDTHREDPLAELQLTTRPMYEAALLTRKLAEELCDGRWVAVGGGGYQPYRVIPRAWSLVWMAMTGREVPAQVDQDFADVWEQRSGMAVPLPFFDPPAPNPRADRAHRQNQEALERLLELLEF
ncbi:MAG: acetoin utilization protein AcuC [Planctomycetota bacterium]|jgi:acetoin utilization protein AcuC